MSIGLSREAVAARVEDDGGVTLAEFMNTLSDLRGQFEEDVVDALSLYAFVASHLAVYVSGNELLDTIAAAQAQYGAEL